MFICQGQPLALSTECVIVDDILHGNKSGAYIVPGHNGGTLQVEMHPLGDKNSPPEGGRVEPTVKYNNPDIQVDEVVRRRRATDDGTSRLYFD